MADCDFHGRVALVTGAGGGLGRQYAIDLARAGAQVMINSVQRDPAAPSKAKALAEELAGEGLAVAYDTGDMSIEAQARGAVARTVREFGRIDILINNAGAGGAGTAQETTTDFLRSVMELHLFGMFWAMQEALQHMRAQDYGRIINTASGLGAFGGDNMFSYVTAKAALFGMTKAAALDNMDRNIKVNSLAPIAYNSRGGYFAQIDPRFTEDKLSAARVSPIALFLAHEDCPINGEAIHAAGGRAARITFATVRGYFSETLSCAEALEHSDEIMNSDESFVFKHWREQYAYIP